MNVKKTIRNTVLILASLVVLSAILAYMSGVFHPKVEGERLAVQVRRLSPGATTDTVHPVVDIEESTAVGTLRARRRTSVSAKIMATISQITVSAGDRVSTGQVLVRLDDRDLQARVEQAKKAVEAASASADKAAADVKRYQSLFETKVVSRQELDKYISADKVARADLQRAREAANEARVGLSYAIIKAPTDGVVVDKQVDAGDTATPGQPLLSVYDPQTLRLEAAVREALATRLKVGVPLKTRIASLDLDLEGRVDEIVPQALAESRSVLVKVAIPARPNLVEGMYGQLSIPTRERRRYCLAESAVVSVGQLRFVDVVTTGGVLERRYVTMGEHGEYGRREVLSGVNEGETVLLHGPPPPDFPPDHRLFGKETR